MKPIVAAGPRRDLPGEFPGAHEHSRDARVPPGDAVAGNFQGARRPHQEHSGRPEGGLGGQKEDNTNRPEAEALGLFVRLPTPRRFPRQWA